MTDPHEARRTRAGAGAAVAGDPADETLSALIDQFSERTAFVRELVQNSLDAGSGRIELTILQPAGRPDALEIAVIDDGEGMDRAVMEGELLTLFRSSKERDQTRIGKFGIGFVSVFALAPEVVVVESGRDGLAHRLVFDPARRYRLLALDEPMEGTAVRLVVPLGDQRAASLAETLRAAAHRWCRFARAEITTRGEGQGWGWPEEAVSHPFTVDAPLVVEESTQGFRVALGFTADEEPMVGYYNRGLTLLERREAVIPGVTFRVECDALGYTLSRDNVRRDDRYHQVMSRVRALAEGPLRERWRQALQQAVDSRDHGRHSALLAASVAPLSAPPGELACLRTAAGGLVAPSSLRPRRLRRAPALYHAPGPSAVVSALEARGAIVLLGPDWKYPEARLAQAIAQRPVADAQRGFLRPQLDTAPRPLVEAASAFEPIRAARFQGGGHALAGRLAIRQAAPGALVPVEEWAREAGARPLVVDVEHPLYQRLEALPIAIAAPALVQAARRAAGDDAPPEPALVQALTAALTAGAAGRGDG